MEPTIREDTTVKTSKKKRHVLSEHELTKILTTIKRDSQPDAYFYIMVVLSCSMATYGLLSNTIKHRGKSSRTKY